MTALRLRNDFSYCSNFIHHPRTVKRRNIKLFKLLSSVYPLADKTMFPSSFALARRASYKRLYQPFVACDCDDYVPFGCCIPDLISNVNTHSDGCDRLRAITRHNGIKIFIKMCTIKLLTTRGVAFF